MALKLLGSLESSGGNVGIGTSSPDSKLHVEGSTDGTGTGADAILHVKQNGGWNGNEPWALYVEGYSYLNGFRINAADGIRALHKVSSGGQLGFSVTDTAPITFTQSNSTERMRVHTDGNVGIGTANPGARLEVASGQADTIINSTTAGQASRLRLKTTTREWRFGTHNGQSNNLWIYDATASAYRFVINTSGNVGMGTTSPNAPLHIGPLTGGNGTAQERLRLTGDYTATGSGVLLRFTNQHNSGANPNTGEYNLAGIVAYDYQSDWGGALAFQTAPSTSAGGNLTTRMTIDQFGKVGIGDTSPDTNLHVHSAGGSGVVTQIKVSQADDGAGHAGADAILQSSGWGEAFLKLGGHKAYAGGGDFNIESATDLALKSGGSTTRMFINSSGNIGMGTTGPIAKLDVQSTGLAANPTIQIVNTSSSTFNHSINALAPNLTTGENNIFIIGRAASVKNSGYIGYKYSAAGSNLNVLTFGHWASDNLMNLTGDGKLGIGTENPGYKLDVTDSARIDGVRIGRDFSVNNRATVRIDSNGNAPSDILFGHTAAADQGSWTGVHWGISARDSGSAAAQGDKFTIWRGAGHTSPNNSENQVLTITPDLKMGIGATAPSTKLHVNGVITATSGTSTNWNTAYGWGNHASGGYSTATGVANNADVTPSWVPATDPSYLTSLPSHNHDDRYYTETELNGFFKSVTHQGNYISTANWSNDGSGSVNQGWGAEGYPFSPTGDFNQNGSGSENTRTIAELPNGAYGVVWRTPSNDASSGADGGWDLDIRNVQHAKAYRSVVYFQKTDDSTSGTFYHGCHGSHTLQMNGNPDTNPYFQTLGFSNLVENRWYVSVGYIQPYQYPTATNSTRSGIYDCYTGKKITNGTDYMMKSGSTTQRHRTYQYYSTDPSSSINWWNPRFEEINGNEPSLADLIQRVGVDGELGLNFHSKFPAGALDSLSETTDATNDKILLWDESADVWKQMTLEDLQDSIDTDTTNAATLDGIDSSSFLRSDTSDVFTFNTSTSEALKFANNTSGGLIQIGFQQNDTDGMHHRTYLQAEKSSVGSAAGKFNIIVRGNGGSTSSDVLELEADQKVKWQGSPLASESWVGSSYAPLASPALTGTPTAPTAAATVNTTQLATTAFVQTAIADLSDSAPATLNTLNELAAALGDDASFSTTVTNSIAAKLPLAGGNLTGNLGINSSTPQAPLDVQPNSSYKVTKVGDDRTSHYKFTGQGDHTLTLSSGSYYSSEVVITAHQTNGGTNNNLYIRGIWTNNHTSHHWHEIENIGGLSGSAFTITNGQSGDTTNSGELEIVHDYVSGSFGQMVVRVTDHYGTHSYTIS